MAPSLATSPGSLRVTTIDHLGGQFLKTVDVAELPASSSYIWHRRVRTGVQAPTEPHVSLCDVPRPLHILLRYCDHVDATAQTSA
jgi:hypothetical protein